jgi:hypothetical protein
MQLPREKFKKYIFLQFIQCAVIPYEVDRTKLLFLSIRSMAGQGRKKDYEK